MKPDKELEEIWNEIPENTDILITHSPSFKTLDMTTSGIHAGSKTLAKRIHELNIKYCISGHLHESYGIDVKGKITYINCSVLDEYYRLVHNPIDFDY
jgi:Icc-related predicted phosphoesterase